jgi:hypothetical protein
MRRIVIAALTLWLACSANAMDFEYRTFTIGSNAQRVLYASGPIITGDTGKLARLIARRPEDFLRHGHSAVLDSNGGNLAEAMDLAKLFGELLIQVYVLPPAKCASACFFVYAGSASRFAFGAPDAPTLAIHRPYFESALTERMDPTEAARAHAAAFEKARNWLHAQLVPSDLVDKLFALPSTDAYWLTDRDVRRIGVRAPWFEEWILARCPDFVHAEREALKSPDMPMSAEASARLKKNSRCAADVIGPAREEQVLKLTRR